MIPPPPSPTLFPYTTLFRSRFAAGWRPLPQHLQNGALLLLAIFRAVLDLQIKYGSEYGERSEEHTSELQSRRDLVCRLLLEKKKNKHNCIPTNNIMNKLNKQ